jgi:hypothetical protein
LKLAILLVDAILRSATKCLSGSFRIHHASKENQDRPPTGTDRILSVLPYLLPIFVGLGFERVQEHANTNVFLARIVSIYHWNKNTLWGSVSLCSACCLLSQHPRFHRFIRYNHHNAIFLAGVLICILHSSACLYPLPTEQPDWTVPPRVTAWGTDGILAVALLTVTYASICSLLGIQPIGISILDPSVEDPMPDPYKKEEEKDTDTLTKNELMWP